MEVTALSPIAGLAVTDSNFIVGDGTKWVAESSNTARTSLGLGTGDSPTFTGLTLNTLTFDFATQDYLITDRDEQYLAIQSRLDDTVSSLELFAKKGDGGDNVALVLWGIGTPGDISDYESLVMQYSASATSYQIYTTSTGSGTDRTLDLASGVGNLGQLSLTNDGNVSINGTLTLPTTNEINFRDADISIGSTLFDGYLDISADIGVDFFYDNADVGDANDGQSLYIYRRAGEGTADDYLQFYIDSDRYAIINANQTLKIQRQHATKILIGSTEIAVTDGLTVNTTDLVVDAVNHRVGIGVAPAVRLHIQTVDCEETSITASSTNTAIRIHDAIATGTGPRWGISWMGDSDRLLAAIEPDVSSGWDTHLNFYTRQGGTLVNALHLDESGKVGIGTTSPGETLEVRGKLLINSDNRADLFFYDDDGYGNNRVTVFNRLDDGLYIRELQDDRSTIVGTTMTLLRGGNVGIGVTDPHSKLEVNGAISSAITTITESEDDIDVSGVNILFVNPGAATIIGGFTNGVAGQVLFISAVANGQDVTMQHNDAGNTQKVFLHTGGDETLSHEYGGWTLVCDGSNWYDTEHSKHV